MVSKKYFPESTARKLSCVLWHKQGGIYSENTTPIPPTHGSLVQHIKRAKFQAMLWGAAHEAIVPRGDPLLYGWENGKYKVFI